MSISIRSRQESFEFRNVIFFFLIAFGLIWIKGLLIIFDILKVPSGITSPGFIPYLLIDIILGSPPTVAAFLMAAAAEGKAGV